MAKASLALRKLLNLQENQRSAVRPRPMSLDADRFDIAFIERPSSVPDARAPSELPYEWLFSAASEPILIVEATLGSIVEANPAAAELLRTPRRALIGTSLQESFEASSSRALQVSLGGALRAGSAVPICVRMRNGGTELSVGVSLVRVAPHAYLLVRLAARSRTGLNDHKHTIASMVLDAIDGASIGFLMTDAELNVEYANRAFIEMLDFDSMEDLRGRSLTRWVKFSTRDFAQLRAQMSQRQALSIFSAILRSRQEVVRDVELHAVAVPDEHKPSWAFSVCPRTRLN